MIDDWRLFLSPTINPKIRGFPSPPRDGFGFVKMHIKVNLTMLHAE
jgi:hypothetical protein